ncbi:MAG TPA: hypothetical protein VMI55_06780 [Thermoplasmata archaeon]|nr:hypothetical protein [Thermoplasmata archaeon]
MGYEGNSVIYPTIFPNVTELPAESASGESLWTPGSLPYSNSTWPENYASIATSYPTYHSYYQTTGGSDYNFVVYFWAAAGGSSQYYTTGCDTQNYSCSANAEEEVVTWTPYQELEATASSMPSGFDTEIQGTTYGINMTAGNEHNLNTLPNPNSPAAASYIEDIALQVLGNIFPPVGWYLSAVAITSDLDHLFGVNGQYSGNGLSDNFAPVDGSGTVNEWGVTGNGTELNSSYSCPPPSPAPTITWNYPKPNPCAPTESQTKLAEGQNTFGQSFGVYTSTGAFASLADAEAVLGSVTTATSVSIGVQNNIETYLPLDGGTFYGSTSTPGASASLTYYFAPAIALDGTVIQSQGQTSSPVGGATVDILQSCPSKHAAIDDLYTQTANSQGQWYFFGNPACTFYYSAQGSGPYGAVGSPTETLLEGTVPAGDEYTFPTLHLNNFPVTIAANGYTYGTSWSATLSNSSGSQTLSTSTADSLTFYAPNATYTLTVTAPTGDIATPASFSVTVAGASITETTSFGKAPTEYTVSFSESGLLGFSWDWSVTLNGQTLTYGSSPIPFSEANGTYTYSVGAVTDYSASPSSGSVKVAGASEGVSIKFTPTVSTFTAKFTESGLPSSEVWDVGIAGGTIGATSPAANSVTLLKGSYPWTAYDADVVIACGILVSEYRPSPSTGTMTGTSGTVTQAITYTLYSPSDLPPERCIVTPAHVGPPAVEGSGIAGPSFAALVAQAIYRP